MLKSAFQDALNYLSLELPSYLVMRIRFNGRRDFKYRGAAYKNRRKRSTGRISGYYGRYFHACAHYLLIIASLYFFIFTWQASSLKV